jgi:hypothetical protein
MTDGRTAELITQAEGIVGSKLEHELSEHLKLLGELTNFAGDLIEEIQNAPGDPRAIHVCAFLLSRLVTDLRACALLVRHGYAAQALSLTAGMLEIAHTSMYIGADEARANEWLSHADVKRASPWSLKTTISAVAHDMGVAESVAEREYNDIYSQACMAKHGHPIALGAVGIVSEGDSIYVVSGPYLSDSTRRWSHVAISQGIRYTKVASIKFMRDHLPDLSQRPELMKELNRLTVEHQRLMHADAEKFGALSAS